MTRASLFIALKAAHGFWQNTATTRRCTCGHTIRATSSFKGWPQEQKHMLEKLNELKGQ